MPTLNFEIESYTVLTSQSGTAASGSWRVLTLTSRALDHRIRSRATVYFMPNPVNAGRVTNVDQPNYNGLTVYAFARKEDFPVWYDMLRNERPMSFTCSYAGPDFDPATPNRDVNWFQLLTGDQEPPGEGPEGSDLPARLMALSATS